jgi:hypothetical protein
VVRHLAYIHSATVERDFTNSKRRDTKQECLTLTNANFKCPHIQMLTQIPNPLTFLSLLTNGKTQTANEATASAYGAATAPSNSLHIQMELLKPISANGASSQALFQMAVWPSLYIQKHLPFFFHIK